MRVFVKEKVFGFEPNREHDIKEKIRVGSKMVNLGEYLVSEYPEHVEPVGGEAQKISEKADALKHDTMAAMSILDQKKHAAIEAGQEQKKADRKGKGRKKFRKKKNEKADDVKTDEPIGSDKAKTPESATEGFDENLTSGRAETPENTEQQE